jgi:acetyl-CoA synthetase
LRDYQTAYQEFSLEKLEHEILHGSLIDGLNGCIECCDKWAADSRIALNWIGRDAAAETLSFAELQDASARFANLLRSYGVGRGDTVAGLLPRVPELLIAVLGTWRAGAMYQPLFTAFGPAAIEHRVTAEGGSHAKPSLSLRMPPTDRNWMRCRAARRCC